MRSLTAISQFIFFFNDTATTEIYTLSLHDALPICDAGVDGREQHRHDEDAGKDVVEVLPRGARDRRSEEHTSELQSRQYLVCRLLLEKKKKYHCLQHHNEARTDHMWQTCIESCHVM